jgi:hypothetical protein
VVNVGVPRGGQVGPDVAKGDGVVAAVQKEISRTKMKLSRIKKDVIRLGEEEADERIQVCMHVFVCVFVCLCVLEEGDEAGRRGIHTIHTLAYTHTVFKTVYYTCIHTQSETLWHNRETKRRRF